MREPTFWKTTAWALAALLAAILLADASEALAMALEARAFVISCLVCIGVGATVLSSRTSPMRVDAAAERAVRGRQTVAALAVAIPLTLLLQVPDALRGLLPWFLSPVIDRGWALTVRAWYQRRKRSA